MKTGSIIITAKRGIRIVGAEELVYLLTKAMKTTSIILTVDVDGIYDKDPKSDPNAKEVRELTPKTLDKVSFGPSYCTGITGGV